MDTPTSPILTFQPVIADILSRRDNLSEAIQKGHLTPSVSRYLTPGWAYLYKDAGGATNSNPALAFAATGNALEQFSPTDEGSIAYVVTTSDEDRDGDIVRPLGGHLINYSRNPLVFFGHQEWEIPIGVCRSPDGRITVYPEEQRMIDVIHFDRADSDADFIYNKCKRKILNATSIAFVPIEAWRRNDVQKARTHSQGGESGAPPGWYFNQWDKTEVSIVGVPSNPKAVGLEKDLMGACRDVLDREKSFMSLRLQKAWQPYCATPQGSWSGWAPVPNPSGQAFLLAVEKAVPLDVEGSSTVPFGDRRVGEEFSVDVGGGNYIRGVKTSADKFKKPDGSTISVSQWTRTSKSTEPSVEKSLEKGTPEGPYVQQQGMTTGSWYLVQTSTGYSFVQDGQQPNQGHVFPDKREAIAWIRDNGFVKKSWIPNVEKDIGSGAVVKALVIKPEGNGFTLVREGQSIPLQPDLHFSTPEEAERWAKTEGYAVIDISTNAPGGGGRSRVNYRKEEQEINEMEETKAQPSDNIDPEKACQILRDGTVNGVPITEEQRGMFGAACAKASKSYGGLRETCKALVKKSHLIGAYKEEGRKTALHDLQSGTTTPLPTTGDEADRKAWQESYDKTKAKLRLSGYWPGDKVSFELGIRTYQATVVPPGTEQGYTKVRIDSVSREGGPLAPGKVTNVQNSSLTKKNLSRGSVSKSAKDDLLAAFDRMGGSNNFVSLEHLRAAVPLGRSAFDQALNDLRREGKLTMSAAEGRHGITPAQRDAALKEGDDLLLYVSRRKSVAKSVTVPQVRDILTRAGITDFNLRDDGQSIRVGTHAAEDPDKEAQRAYQALRSAGVDVRSGQGAAVNVSKSVQGDIDSPGVPGRSANPEGKAGQEKAATPIRTEGGTGPGEWQTAYFKTRTQAIEYADQGIRSTPASKTSDGLWVIRVLMRASSTQAEGKTVKRTTTQKGDNEDYDAGYDRGKKDAEAKKRQDGKVEPMRGKPGAEAYDLGYERGWNSVKSLSSRSRTTTRTKAPLASTDGRIGGYTVPPTQIQVSDGDPLPTSDTNPEGYAACESCHSSGSCDVCGGDGEFGGEDCVECGGSGECGSCAGEGHMEKQVRKSAVQEALTRLARTPHITNAMQVENWAADQWFNQSSASREFSGKGGHKRFAAAVVDEWKQVNQKSATYRKQNSAQLAPQAEDVVDIQPTSKGEDVTTDEEQPSLTTPQVLAALYSHAKAEAAYIDQLDEQYKDALADYRADQLEKRMEQLKDMFGQEYQASLDPPEEALEKLCKEFEGEEEEKGMESTGPDNTMEPGEAGLVEQGQVPPETMKSRSREAIASLRSEPDYREVKRLIGTFTGFSGALQNPNQDRIQKLCERLSAKYPGIYPGEINALARDDVANQKSKGMTSTGPDSTMEPGEVGIVEQGQIPETEDDMSTTKSTRRKTSEKAGTGKYRCTNCGYVAGDKKPDECPDCHETDTFEWATRSKDDEDDIEKAGDPGDEIDAGPTGVFNKAEPGSEEWAEEEAMEPEHKAGDDDEVVIDKEEDESEEKAGGGICMCGMETPEGATECPGCGAPVKGMKAEDPPAEILEPALDEEKAEPFAGEETPEEEALENKNSDPAAEEILERYQHPKSAKWATRKWLVNKSLLPFLKHRVAANGKKYLVRAETKASKTGSQLRAGDSISVWDGEKLPSPLRINSIDTTPDGDMIIWTSEGKYPVDSSSRFETKSLTTKLAGAIDDLKALATAKDLPRQYKACLKHVADQIWYVGKALTDKGKEQKNGGKGSELNDKGKVQANGKGGGELKDKGEQQGKSPSKSYTNGTNGRTVSPVVEQKMNELMDKLRRNGLQV